MRETGETLGDQSSQRWGNSWFALPEKWLWAHFDLSGFGCLSGTVGSLACTSAYDTPSSECSRVFAGSSHYCNRSGENHYPCTPIQGSWRDSCQVGKYWQKRSLSAL